MLDLASPFRPCPRSARRRAGLVLPWLLAGALFVSAGVAAEPVVRNSPQTFSVLFENDLFGDSDRQYTNGLKLGWLSSDLNRLDPDWVPRWILGLVGRLGAFEDRLTGDPSRQFNLGVAVGQKMFTPDDTQTVEVVTDDRPYAGWLYGVVSFVSKTETVADTLEIQLGVVGPASLAEQAQRLVHELRDLPVPRGWDNQLDNEPGVILFYERKWRLDRRTLFEELGYDAIAHAGLAVGNVMDYGAGGMELRLGWNLPLDFGTSLIRPGGDANAPTVLSGGTFRGLGAYGFAALGGRLVARNIFLDGNTFGASHEVDKNLLVGDLVVGASLLCRGVKLSYAQVFRTREFEGQDRFHNFGSISLSWSF